MHLTEAIAAGEHCIDVTDMTDDYRNVLICNVKNIQNRYRFTHKSSTITSCDESTLIQQSIILRQRREILHLLHCSKIILLD